MSLSMFLILVHLQHTLLLLPQCGVEAPLSAAQMVLEVDRF
jgi:hypothetical protein